ncbi:hypothetical protein L1887_58608 [Cichorium endivia]|nr:hypothetical protein L1887_58608 [Cichorium endivia]
MLIRTKAVSAADLNDNALAIAPRTRAALLKLELPPSAISDLASLLACHLLGPLLDGLIERLESVLRLGAHAQPSHERGVQHASELLPMFRTPPDVPALCPLHLDATKRGVCRRTGPASWPGGPAIQVPRSSSSTTVGVMVMADPPGGSMRTRQLRSHGEIAGADRGDKARPVRVRREIEQHAAHHLDGGRNVDVRRDDSVGGMVDVRHGCRFTNSMPEEGGEFYMRTLSEVQNEPYLWGISVEIIHRILIIRRAIWASSSVRHTNHGTDPSPSNPSSARRS